MNIKSYVEKHANKIIFIFLLEDLKRKIKKDTVFLMKEKNSYTECTFDYHKCRFQLKTEMI